MFEMVRGFLQRKFAPTRKRVLKELASLGYAVELHDVDVADYGLAQTRQRCLIIGHRTNGLITPPERQPRKTVQDMFTELGPPSDKNRHEIQGGEARAYPERVSTANPEATPRLPRGCLVGCLVGPSRQRMKFPVD